MKPARETGSRKPISKRLRFAVFERDEFRCRYCGRGNGTLDLHVDHYIAVANGGSNDIENLVTACVDCNLGKSDRVLRDPTIGALRRCADLPDVKIRGEDLNGLALWIGKEWVVSTAGVECRDGTYFIDKSRVWENEEEWPWEFHMAEKEWVDLEDFCHAIHFARKRWKLLSLSAPDLEKRIEEAFLKRRQLDSFETTNVRFGKITREAQ